MIAEPVLAALDRLNAHARAWGCGKSAIYAYKELAARLLVASGDAKMRPVALMAKCRNCLGTGWFHDWYEGKTDSACRTCGRTGYVHLRFVEMTAGWHVWHHPWTSCGRDLFQAVHGDIEYNCATRAIHIVGKNEEVSFESPGDWAPNVAGERVEGDIAADLFNTVEGWVLSLPAGGDTRFALGEAIRKMQSYSLRIGNISNSCHYCGDPNFSICQGHRTKHLEWSVPVCRQHEKIPVTEWDNKFPAAAVTPAITRWLSRRNNSEMAA
jgi:hypothetical protein